MIKPLSDVILVKPLQRNGLAFDDSEQVELVRGLLLFQPGREPYMGEVLAIGPGILDDKLNLTKVPVKVGDVIVWTRGSVIRRKIDGKFCYFVKASCIVGVER